MYSWRCFIAIAFILVWYLSDFGQLWAQAFLCFLCFFSLPLKNQERESSTQTEDLNEETTEQIESSHQVGIGDEPDATKKDQSLPQTTLYPIVHKSLLQVFKSVYAHLVQPWYTPPEVGDSQLLYMALQEEFNQVVERIMCKAQNFDVSATSVGCVRILTRHLHNAKQPESSPMFSSKSEEMSTLRTFSEVLVRNFFPEHLWEPKLYQCVLTEIVATKALDVLVTTLCDPDNLNQMVVMQLDQLTPKSSLEDLLNSDREGTPSSEYSEGTDVLTDEAEENRSKKKKKKKKGNKLKEKFSRFVDKVKFKNTRKKKVKNNEKEKALLVQQSDDDGTSCKGSNIDSDNDSNIDVYTTIVQENMMEFKLSYEMWRKLKWTVCVTKVQKENNDLWFTVHVEETNNPENLHWDVRKTQSDISQFYKDLQDASELPSISTIMEKSNKEIDETVIEEIRSALEQFLQVLVSDEKLGLSQSVFQFLCPLAWLLSNEEHQGGVWSLLSGLANFLTPGQDEDDSHKPKKQEKLDEAEKTVNNPLQNAAQPACIDISKESDMDVYPTSVQDDRPDFNQSYEKWRVRKWAVCVTNVQTQNEELWFTVHVEERNNPENIHWDVRKTLSDILQFHKDWKDTSELPSISTIVEKSKKENGDTYTEDVRSALEQFLQLLLSDEQLGLSQSVFQFLLPSKEEHEGGVWSLLNRLANFLTPDQDEEDVNSHNLRNEDRINEAGDTVNITGQNGPLPVCTDTSEESDGDTEPLAADIGVCTPLESKLEEKINQITDPDIVPDKQESLAENIKILSPFSNSNDSINRNEGLQTDAIDCFKSCSFGKTNKKEKLPHRKSDGLQKLKVKTLEATNQPQVQKQELNHTNWEQQEATKAICDLLKEITGNSVFINIFVDAILKPFMPLIKKKINGFLDKLNPTEAQIASYIDNFLEKMWPDGNASVQPPRDSEEKTETKQKALQLINSKYSNPLILKKTDVETVFKVFQDTVENKKLVYMLLSYVLGAFLPEEPVFNTVANVTVKDFCL